MLKQFKMMYLNSCPIIFASTQYGYVQIFVDTGAAYPVWTGDYNKLEKYHCRQISKNEAVTIEVLGGNPRSTVYVIDISINGIGFIDLPILVSRMERFPADLLISSGMLSQFNIQFNNQLGTMIFDTIRDAASYELLFTNESGSVFRAIDALRDQNLLIDTPIPLKETKLWRDTFSINV